MHIWIGVENFAKIESAKICIDNYTVLVGQNNSGKTFLMQLVQGVSKKLTYFLDEEIMNTISDNEEGAVKEYIINSQNIEKLVSYINSKLFLEKETIVREIFGKEISIGKLYIDIQIEMNIAYNIFMYDVSRRDEINNIEYYTQNTEKFVIDLMESMQAGMVCIVNKENTKKKDVKLMSVHFSFSQDEVGILKKALGSIIELESLFLPASRTGLLLLYRDFFANRTDNELSFTIKNDKMIEKRESNANLTKPVYEFLRFLQTYSERDDSKEAFKKELQFFEEHLIEGHISVNKQGVFSYRTQNEKEGVPMYLASSMINEVAPLVLAITSQNKYGRLIIDEVEASLHPQKQLELVRFLNRLNNKGMKLIISTHSDTFVSKLNNIYILSEMIKSEGDDVLKQFGLEREDLVSPEKLFVYEVVNQPNGMSVVREIKPDKKMGYQFDLFTDSAIHLYEEAAKLGEMQ